jgi:hypothetical protein
MFDFSGFRYSEYVGEHILNARAAILNFLHIPEGLGVAMPDHNKINNRLIEVKMGTGLLGFLLFLPSVFLSVIFGFFKNKKLQGLFAFGLMFLINVCCLSFSIAYMVFSVRFITFLMIISSPVLALSYIRKTNIIKLLILFFVMSYFLVMSTNLASRPVIDILKVVVQEKTLNDAREKIRCALFTGYEGRNPFCYLRDIIRNSPKGTSFAIFPSVNSRLYIVNMLNNEGYKIDTFIAEKAAAYDLSNYEYAVLTDSVLHSTVLMHKTEDTKIDYKVTSDNNAYYEKKRPVACIYSSSDKIVSSGMKNVKIISSDCYIMDDFFNERGFYKSAVYNFPSDILENYNLITIYKNKSKVDMPFSKK